MPKLFKRIIQAKVFGGEMPEALTIEPIGEDWTSFAGSADRARYVPSNAVTGSIVDYEAQEGSLFPLHMHDRREEGYIIGGPVTVRDEKGNQIMALRTGDSFTLEPEQVHEFLFHGPSLLRLRYTPGFEVADGKLQWTAFRPSTQDAL